MTYTMISLFSGAVDGLAIAAQAAGIQVTHHVEIDAWCCKVLRMNHPNAIVINKDIHDVRNLPSATIVAGGSPCQDFSLAGNRAGFDGERYLWPEMRRIVRECRPRCVIHENVRGGVSAGLLDRICSDLEADGYTAWPMVFPAVVFGAPHERYRMFIVGLMADTSSQRRAEPGTQPVASADQKQHLSSLERAGRTVADAAQSGGQDVVNPIGSGRGEYDLPRFTSEAGHADRRPDANSGHEWALSQSGVGLFNDGITTKLPRPGGVSNVKTNTQTNTRKILPPMRRKVRAQTFQRYARGFRGFQSQKVLRPILLTGRSQEAVTNAIGLPQKSIEISQTSMRNMRIAPEFTSSPSGLERNKQQSIQLNDLVRLMSHEVALGAWENYPKGEIDLQDLRSATRQITRRDVPEALAALQEIWRPLPNETKAWIIFRASEGSRLSRLFPAGQGVYQHAYEPPRTTPTKGEYANDRIQALGNAVVWQQAAPVFRAAVKWLEANS